MSTTPEMMTKSKSAGGRLGPVSVLDAYEIDSSPTAGGYSSSSSTGDRYAAFSGAACST